MCRRESYLPDASPRGCDDLTRRPSCQKAAPERNRASLGRGKTVVQNACPNVGKQTKKKNAQRDAEHSKYLI